MPRRPRAKHAIPLARGASRPGGGEGVLLAWARDRDGKKVRASKLAGTARRERAPFTCLGCDEELVPHLGRVRTPHFSHRAGSTCPLTAPETALHLDAKERLLLLCADAFAGRRRLRALARCPECRRPAPVDVGAIGDTAEDEAAVGALRADVLVRSGGKPALAIEVKVTHAVEPEKEAALASAGVPAVELDAREEWEREVEGGVDLVCARSFAFGPCPACRARARADRERDLGGEAAEIAELEAYRARGLLGPPPPAPAEPPGDPEAPLGRAEGERLRARFRCPDCGGAELQIGTRLATHPCPAAPDGPGQPRPVAWRGYDGSLVVLGWWSRRRAGGADPGPGVGRKPH